MKIIKNKSSHLIINTTKVVLIGVAITSIAACSFKTSVSNSSNTENIINISSDANSKNETANNSLLKLNDNKDTTKLKELLIKDNSLFYNYQNKSLKICELLYNEFFQEPKSLVISNDDFFEYTIVYYSYPRCGYKGADFYVYALKYDKKQNNLDIIWKGDDIFMNHNFNKNTINLSIPDSGQETLSTDLTPLFKRMDDENMHYVLNGNILISTVSNIGVKDYNFDGKPEVFLQYDIVNTEKNIYLTSVYLIMGIKDNLVINKSFTGDHNNKVINDIMNQTFAIAENEVDYQYLLELGIIKKQKDKLYMK